MAPRQAAAPAAEISEREYQATLNRAVADTEGEIFGDALGEQELDNDGDTSLEDMGDGLEGDIEDDDAGEDKGEEGDEPEAEGEEGEETETAEGDGGDAEFERDNEPVREQTDRQYRPLDRNVPSGRLKEEADRRRAAEERNLALERQIAEYNGRLTELSARVNAAPKAVAAEAPAKPDMFADPAAYENWVITEAERRADAKIEQRLNSFQQQQQQRDLQRVDRSLEAAARGQRSFEFSAAYNALTTLDPRDRGAQQTVSGILASPDPAKALFDWWDQNGGEEYREQLRQQLFPDDQRPGPRGQQQPRNGRQQSQQQPRHVIRPAQSLPSLNSATGSNSQRTADPEMQDGSEASVFAFGSRR